MSEDLRAALAASERRTARAEEEARVARHERDEAVASAARLREALRTFAEDADEPPEDDREETDYHVLREEEHDQRPSDSTTNFTRVAAPFSPISRDASEASSLRSEISSLRAKLRSALESAQSARRDADEAARASTASKLELDAAVARLEASRNENVELKRRVESANAATALARRQVAETSASLRRGLGAVSGDQKTSPKADPKRERMSATTKASDDVNSDDELQKNKRDQEKDDAEFSKRAAKEKETLATLAAMETTVARLASTLRAREKELDDTRATVATLVRERGERERAFEERRIAFSGRTDEIQKTETGSRRSPAAVALAKARTLANRNRRDRPVSRARAFTSTKSHGYE